MQLTDIQSLKGVFGVTRYVLGCISKSEDGRFVLEDAGGSVPLDLSAAETAAGFYTENCIVIAEGSLGYDGVFHARALGFPPTEPRSELPMAAQKLNLFGGTELCPETVSALEGEEVARGSNDRMVVLSNVWLDQQDVIDNLHFVFRGETERGRACKRGGWGGVDGVLTTGKYGILMCVIIHLITVWVAFDAAWSNRG